MEGLTLSYWMRHRAKVLLPAAVFFALLLFALWKPPAKWDFLLPVVVVQLLVCAQYSLNTAVGRLWWGSIVLACGGGVAAVSLGIHHPFCWVWAEVAALAYGIGVCLRWNPPAKSE